MIHTEFKGVAMTGSMDCSSKEQLKFAKALGVKKYPSVRVFPALREKKSFTLIYDNLVEVSMELENQIKPNVKQIDLKADKGLLEFVSTVRYKNALGVLLIHEAPCPLAVQALSDDPVFRDTLVFGQTKETKDQKMLAAFGVRRLPALVTFEVVTDDLKVLPRQMDGDFYDYGSTEKFLALQLNAYYQREIQISQEELEEEEIDHFTASSFTS